MFFGERKHTIDEKNRIRIPKEYRAELGMDIVIGHGVNKCLYVYPLETFVKLNEDKIQIDEFDYEKQYALSGFISSYSKPEIDSQGRFILPKELKNFANIKKNIVTRGVRDRIEIWSEEELGRGVAEAGSKDAEILGKKA